MDERRVRYTAGRNGDGTVHRVGLTRHCLASGRIQLPFALRETIPEGELLAHDVERDATWVLESLPPRRLAGLRPFFAAHELEVNDLLELRMSGPEVRLAPVRRARRAAPAEDVAAGDAPAGRPPPTAKGSSPRRDAVVDRIGSVTVRRLGAGTFASPAAAALPDPAPEDPVDAAAPGAASPAPSTHAAALGASAPLRAETEPEEAAPLLADAEPAEPPPAAATAPPPPAAAIEDEAASGPTERPAEQLHLFGAASRGAPVRPRPRSGRGPVAAPGGAAPEVPAPRAPEPAPVRESDLLDAAEARAVDRSGRDAPPLGWLRRPPAGRERSQAARAQAAPSRPTPRPAPRDAAGSGPGEAFAATPPDPRRAREEALSRAGDLRSRMVRWLLDPATPVIVQHERVQQEFGLESDVARDVLGGILEDPPPSLRLTVLRAGLIRVSRVTVEQEA